MMKGRPLLLCAAILTVLHVFFVGTAGIAVMSIDLGSEFMKVAIVKPGVPMEIALNAESRRKTPVVVAVRDGERTIGDPALAVAVKYPDKAFWYLQDLLGKTVENPAVQQYQKRFQYYDIERDADTGTVVFKHDNGTSYTPEELLAMVLERAKEIASNFAEIPVRETVITVPVFFNQAERRALMRAAEMAGLTILQLMNDNTAVALNYGVFRRKNFNSTAARYMFVDMGASSTVATVVSYQNVKSKNPATGISETNPQVAVEGVGYDRSLGGVEFQLRLRDHLAKTFNSQKKTSRNVKRNERAMGKLFKEAGRVKQVLSANNEHYAQIEGLLDDEDFKAKVTREEFEFMCKDLFARVAKPIEDAMKMSEVTWDEINEVILMGGSTRIPKVQEMILKATGKTELGKSVNTDEAAALGAVYQAAFLSKGFKVKKFIVREATLYPIQVEFEKVRDGTDETLPPKVVKRTLFGRGNPYPQKKVMTFNKHIKDFAFEVNYGELDFIPSSQVSTFGNQKVLKASLSGIEPIWIKYNREADPKGVKAHFRMDDSGIIHLDRCEAIYEKEVGAKKDDEASTLQKLGKYFFGNQDQNEATEATFDGEEKKEPEPEAAKPQEEKTENENVLDKEEGPEGDISDEGEIVNESDDSNGEEVEEVEEAEEDKTNKDGDEKEPEPKPPVEEEPVTEEKKAEEESPTEGTEEQTEEQVDAEKPAEDEKKEGDTQDKKPEKKKKMTTIKEKVKADTIYVDMLDPTTESQDASRAKLKELKKKDDERAALAKAKNELETFIFDTGDKLYQEVYEQCSLEEERDTIRTKLSEASDWLDEQDETTKKKEFKNKLKELKEVTKDLFERVEHMLERPKALEALNSVMNYSQHFLKNMENYTGEDQPFTEVEMNTLSKLISETQIWNDTEVVAMLEAPKTEKSKLSIEDIARKIGDIDREVKYLINKAKSFRPKPKEEPIDIKAGEGETVIGDEAVVEEGEKTEESAPDPIEAPPSDDTKTEEAAEEEPLQLDAGDEHIPDEL